MKMLKNTITAVVAIIVLRILTAILDTYSPVSSVFHRQFLFSLQLVVIAWLLIYFLLFVFNAGKSWVASFLPVLLVIFVLGVDVLFSNWVDHPRRIPAFLQKNFKYYYTAYERNMIEYEPCSVYDTAYSFKFIPRLTFSYGNIEYKNQYRTNSESLRDDEGSTMGPQIICVGNTYALGTGVEQNETFPEQLATITGKSVLNTGYSSYGTAKEMKRFINSDTSFTEYLIIQYSRHDVYENEKFIRNGYVVPVISDSVYKRKLNEYKWRREYFPGKYALAIGYHFLKVNVNKLRKKKYFLSADPAVSAKHFLKVIDSYKPGERIKVIVTEINDYNDMGTGFLPAVDSLISDEFSHYADRIQTVDLSGVLSRSDYYIIDFHLRPSGHAKVARKIAEYIK